MPWWTQIAGLQIVTNQGQDHAWPSVSAEEYDNTDNLSALWNNWANTTSPESLEQLVDDLAKWRYTETGQSPENAYSTFLDGSTSSGLLCGLAGEFGYNGKFGLNNVDQNSAILTLGMLFMLPLSPSANIPPATVNIQNPQPVSSNGGLTLSQTVSVPCPGPGAVVDSSSLSISQGDTWSITASTSNTYGYSLTNAWSASASLTIGNVVESYAQGTVTIGYSGQVVSSSQSASSNQINNQVHDGSHS